VNGYIYILTDARNGKQYIGKHNGLKEDYWCSGLVPNRIANKHGREIFTRDILEDGIQSEEYLNEREVFYINKYDTFKNGYNATSGGEGGNSWANQKTEEELAEISRIKSEKMKGRTFSKETIQKMKRSHKGKKLTEEHKKNIGKAMKLRGGVPHTEETKQYLSELRKGIPNPKHSEFMTYNNPNAKPIMIEGIEYRSQNEAARQLGISSAMVKGRLNSKNEKWSNWYRL
jgi:group I intron endonuclease